MIFSWSEVASGAGGLRSVLACPGNCLQCLWRGYSLDFSGPPFCIALVCRATQARRTGAIGFKQAEAGMLIKELCRNRGLQRWPGSIHQI
jgi:hypothetical protein